MANKTIIFKNTTLSGLTVRGKTIPASSSVDFTDYQGAYQFRLAQDVIDPLLASGDLVINNGISDLTVEEAEIFLYDELFFTMDGITDGDVLRGTATQGIAQATPFTLANLTGGIESPAAIGGDVLTFDGTNFVPQSPATVVQIEKDDTLVGSSSVLNFEGDVTVVDEGTKVTIAVVSDPNSGALEFEYAEDDTETCSTSQTFIEKIKMTFTAVASDYLIEWTAEVKSTHAGTKIVMQCQVDDTITINETKTNPDHIFPKVGFGTMSGFKKITLTAGSHDVDVDFKSTSPNQDVCIRNVRVKASRVV